MYINSLNGECKMLTLNCFYSLFIQNKDNKQTKLLTETANHVNFMQHMLVSYSSCYFSSLQGNIAEVSKMLTSGN